MAANFKENSSQENITRPVVFIVDDDRETRNNLQDFVKSIGFQAAAFDSVLDFLSYYKQGMSGCLIMDVRLPDFSGLELQDYFQRKSIRLPIIFLSCHSNVSIAVRTMKAGAIDFLEKPFDEQSILDSIQKAIGINRKEHEIKQQHSHIMEKIKTLTHREEEVLRLLIQGKANKVIAYTLQLSTKTIETHRAHIMKKLGVNSMAGLMWMALNSQAFKEVPEQLPFIPLDTIHPSYTLL